MAELHFVRDRIETELADIRLLDSPFYRRWQAGELHPAELREYAEQYRHFEAALPGVLADIRAALPEGDAADFIADNQADETGETGTAHLDLFSSFLEASGGSADAVASPATAALLNSYRDAVGAGAAAGIAGLIAYESQAAGIAASKGDGLRQSYGYDAEGTRFWDVHAALDTDHAEWALQALAAVTPDDDVDMVVAHARRIGEAWWAFLDERERRSLALAS